MLAEICPKLPMRYKCVTQTFYVEKLGFQILGNNSFEDYLMLKKDSIEMHFFLFKDLDIKENYGQVYIRTQNIEEQYQSFLEGKVEIHPNGKLQIKPWDQKEFSIVDPDHNLLTFGDKAF